MSVMDVMGNVRGLSRSRVRQAGAVAACLTILGTGSTAAYAVDHTLPDVAAVKPRGLADIPPEVLMLILNQGLSATDIHQMESVDHRLYALVNNPGAWLTHIPTMKKPDVLQALIRRFSGPGQPAEARATVAQARARLAQLAVTTIAGTGDKPSKGLLATETNLHPDTMAFAPDGALFVADVTNHHVFRVDPVTQHVTTIAGTGSRVFGGDGQLATETNLYPNAITFAPDGALLIADWCNHRVLRVNPTTQRVTTIAGTGGRVFGGDGQLATETNIHPSGLAFAPDGALLIADWINHRVLRVNPTTQRVTTIAGTGDETFNGDDRPATATNLQPYKLAFAPDGALLIADLTNNRVLRVNPTTQRMTTIAGTGHKDFNGDDQLATATNLSPSGLVFAPDGALLIADAIDHRVLRVNPTTQHVTTIAGTGKRTFNGDDRPATATNLTPKALAITPDGMLLIVDLFNSRVRQIYYSY